MIAQVHEARSLKLSAHEIISERYRRDRWDTASLLVGAKPIENYLLNSIGRKFTKFCFPCSPLLTRSGREITRLAVPPLLDWPGPWMIDDRGAAEQ